MEYFTKLPVKTFPHIASTLLSQSMLIIKSNYSFNDPTDNTIKQLDTVCPTSQYNQSLKQNFPAWLIAAVG